MRYSSAVFIAIFAAVTVRGFSATMPSPAAYAQGSGGFVVKDARNIGVNSVRFAAAQGTERAPNIVLLGGNEAVWPKIRGAVVQAEKEGFPVRAILVGPPSAPPAFEIYAKGQHVTRPINPYAISQADLVKLIRDVHRQHYQ